ncbi:MAG: AAA family ATPase [Treponemataceae bacterium]
MLVDEGQSIALEVSDAFRVSSALIDGASVVIRGKRPFLELLIAASLARGHILIEDLPGLGKTTVAKTFARLISGYDGMPLAFKRIQFTPDLLPYDITGVDIYDPDTRRFRFVPGPIFANVVLADEINRTTPKVQSALLEVMAEGQVTIGATTHLVGDPFIVVATQNPVETEGTFPLPAAQLDRFMLRVSLGYPDKDTERMILVDDPSVRDLPKVEPVVSVSSFKAAQKAVDSVHCHASLIDAVADIVRETRTHRGVALGVSPRGALHFLKASKALAIVRGRDYVTDEDLISVGPPALAHRLKLRDPRVRAESLIREICLERIDAIKRA